MVEAVAWTAIALLATTLVGSFFYLGTRLDSMAETSGDGSTRRAPNSADGSTRMAPNSATDRRAGARIDALSGRMDQHLERHAG